MIKKLLTICITISLTSCNLFTSEEKDKTVAQLDSSSQVQKTESIAIGKDTLVLKNYGQVLTYWDSLGLYLEDLKKIDTLPSMEVQNIAESLCELDVNDKKRAYFTALLFASAQAHDEILDQRIHLKSILAKKQWTSSDSLFVEKIKTEVRYNGKDANELLKKYDVLPLSLIMAQGVLESAWGCSHFAKQGNSLFGEHLPKGAKGAYIQAKGSDIRLKAFPSIKESVLGYIHNINRNHAYKGLRDARAKLRNEGKHLDGIILANTEDHYSELGHEYTKRIISVIHVNKLNELDHLKMDLKSDHLVIMIEN